MKMEWNRSTFIILCVGVILIAAFFFFGQKFMLNPYQETVEEKEAAVIQEQKVLSAIEKNQDEGHREQLLTSRTIQQQLPVIPLVDQLLIGLDRAENTSTSRINNMAISDSESLIPIQEPEGETGENTEDAQAKEEIEGQQVSDQPEEDEAELLIEGLHTLQFTIGMTSENYGEMVSFMKEIQSLARVIQIESIQFEVPESENELNYSIVLNSFYQPLYADLANEAPQYHYGGSPNKENPFSIEQWGDLTPSVTTQRGESDEDSGDDPEETPELEEGTGDEEEVEEDPNDSEPQSQL